MKYEKIIKIISGMNITETRLPQDGAIKSKIGDKMLDLPTVGQDVTTLASTQTALARNVT